MLWLLSISFHESYSDETCNKLSKLSFRTSLYFLQESEQICLKRDFLVKALKLKFQE